MTGFGKLEWIEEEVVMGQLCRWVKCTRCDNQVFTANMNVLCDECEPPRTISGKKNHKQKLPIPESIRWAVWERDNFTCQHCGSRKKLTVDHIYPESKGGEMTMDNAQTLCKSCNSRKGAR